MMRRLFAMLCLCIACSIAWADDAPRTMLRAHLEPSGPVVAGSAVKLVVDALTTTWFTAAPDWPLFDIHDAFVTLPDESALNMNEMIDGVRWFGVSRAYRIVPRTSGAFDVPAFTITLHPGGTDTPVALQTPALKFSATLPPGAEGMTSFFPAPNLTATQRIEPQDGKLEVGGTVTRIVAQRADATESMLIAPVQFGEIQGLRRYPKPPATRNISEDRTGLVAGERTDTVTYVVNRRGRYELPPIDIEWWNTAMHRRETIHLPAMRFTARAAHEKPLWEIPADGLAGAARHTVIFLDARDIVHACIVLALIAAGVWFYPRMRVWLERLSRWWAAERMKRADGEFAAWRALRRAADSGVMRRVVPALYRWMDASPRFTRPARLDHIGREGEPALTELAKAVEAHFEGPQPAERRARVKLHRWMRSKRSRRARGPALPPLNEG
ncbi:BatD family protein [Caballeronia ptereochthonis]|uniref:Oxygen tolerance protein BatD n=1 Tax=Caballeronia ptereochthonis TaxID=1777144 RepID=A0A158B9M3_9BURK|nr:BatD family protein [Caballeronia ptereochthonis]SAK66778.1 hypothetical protein AWB83_02996 [Caballeronia ptereochthonis]